MEFLDNLGVGIYFLIFFGKILEVTVATVRNVLINRGERKIGSIIAFFEILLWLMITGTVLSGFQEDFLRVIVFAFAFAIGNYMGSWLESKIAIGYCSIQIIVKSGHQSELLVQELRDHNYAATVIRGSGKDGERDMLILHMLRKKMPKALNLVKDHLDTAFVIVNDARPINGGYLKK